jgi:hypothetical protein
MIKDILHLIDIVEEVSLLNTDKYFSYLVYEQEPPPSFLQKHKGKLAGGVLGGLVGNNYLQNHPEAATELSNKLNNVTKDIKDLSSSVVKNAKEAGQNTINSAKNKLIEYNILHQDPRKQTTSELLAMKGDISHQTQNNDPNNPYIKVNKSTTDELRRRLVAGDKSIPAEAVKTA